MAGAYKVLRHSITLLQGCFAGVLFGQMVHLLSGTMPFSFLVFFLITVGAAVLFLLHLFRQTVRRYVLKTSSFLWIHFGSSILYGVVLLLHLLPVIYNFEESDLPVNLYRSGSLIALVFVVAENNLLNINLLQKVYAGLAADKRGSAPVAALIWWLALLVFALISFFLYESGGSGTSQIMVWTLVCGSALLFLLTGVKAVLLKEIRSLFHYHNEEQRGASSCELPEQVDRFHLAGRNLLKDIMDTEEKHRPLLYGKIRQIPLLEKRKELEEIYLKYLPHDKDLEYTILFLQNLYGNSAGNNTFNDYDSLNHIPAIKAFIRLSIEEGNPMLVQKLLNDNRPEVKKAAVLATVHFDEAGFIPALVNLLKDHEYAFAAKEALYGFGDKSLPFLRSGKYRNKDNSFFIEHCLDLVAGFRSEDAKDFLLGMLNEPQKRFRYIAARALLKNGYTLSGLQKTQILHSVESLIGIIAVEREIRYALKEPDGQLAQALLEEEKEKIHLVFDLLEAFVAMPVINLLRSLSDEEPENYGLAVFPLIDLFFPLVLRNKCKILFGAAKDENIAHRLQPEYLNEQIFFNYSSREEAIKQILKMDYGQIGYWLRACALKELAAIPGQQVSMLIQAEVFNENQLMQEVACGVLYDLNYDFYFLQMKRLPPERAKVLKYKIEANKSAEKGAAAEESQLLFTKIQYLKSFPFLKEESSESLAGRTMLFSPLYFSGEKRKINFDPYSTGGYWIVCRGGFRLCRWGEEVLNACKGDIIDMSFLAEAEEDSLTLEPAGEIKIFFMEYYTFNKLYLKIGNLYKTIKRPESEQSAGLHIA